MSHPKSNTVATTVQLPKLRQIEFGLDPLGNHGLFRIQEGQSLTDGLQLAADLSEGASQLSARLAQGINDGEIAYLAEVRALAALSELSSAITRSAQYALQKLEGQL